MCVYVCVRESQSVVCVRACVCACLSGTERASERERKSARAREREGEREGGREKSYKNLTLEGESEGLCVGVSGCCPAVALLLLPR
jgi:hypothetical protein